VNRVASVGFRAGSGFTNAVDEQRAITQTRDLVLQRGFQLKNGETVTSWQWLYARYGESRSVFLKDLSPIDSINATTTILKTPNDVRNWHIPNIGSNTRLKPHKYAARMDLMLSKSVPVLQCLSENLRDDIDNKIAKAYIRKIDDIKSPTGIVMTDGCAPAGANIIASAANVLVSHTILQSNGISTVCAVQGRLGGYKGMWYLDPSLPTDVICVRPSMQKIELDEKTATLSQKQFEALKENTRFGNSASTINKQFALLLEGWGVSKSVFVSLLRDAITPLLKMTQSPSAAMSVLNHKPHNLISQSLNDIEKEATMMLKSGLWGEYRLHFLLQKIRSLRFRALARKPRLLVEKSRTAFILADPTGLLQPGEVYFKDLGSKSSDSALMGQVLLLRNPCYSPEHLVLATAIPKLSTRGTSDAQKEYARLIETSLCGVILFPVTGNEPMAFRLSGGDYDGDVAWICWDSRLVDPISQKTNKDNKSLKKRALELYDRPDQFKPSQAVEESNKWPPTTETLQRLWVASLTNNQLGIASNLHSALIDSILSSNDALIKSQALWDSRAIHLAQLCDANVDAPKTGLVWPVSSHLYTDIMKLREKSYSNSSWGYIQRALQSFSGISDNDKNAEMTYYTIATTYGLLHDKMHSTEVSTTFHDISGLSEIQENGLSINGWKQEQEFALGPLPLIIACAEQNDWQRFKKIAEVHMAIYAREAMSGPPLNWKHPDVKTVDVNDKNDESDSEDELDRDQSIVNIWDSVDFGVTHTTGETPTNKVSIRSTQGSDFKWKSLQHWCLPRARKRLMFKDGAASKQPRSVSDQNALALAYYCVTWQHFQRKTNKATSPRAFPFIVAGDLICDVVFEYIRKRE
jgi:hypothetical protein